MKIQLLVSAVNQDISALVKQMHIQTDAVIVNQCDRYGYEEIAAEGSRIQVFSMPERGVGLSRNTALLHANGEICVFSDEDIVLSEGYAEEICRAYRELPDADMILVNVKVSPARRTYWNEDIHRINRRNYGRYPAYSITARHAALLRANVHYSLLFGGGAKYSNGEDSLFLRDCLKAGLKIYSHTICIGEETERKSTWFSGYHEKFFRDRGVLYHYLYGRMALPLAFRFLWVHRKEMCRDVSLKKAYAWMKAGVREAGQTTGKG
ncbi:MAG: glycosyltransferase family 2 protein [Lachnospiraceae bacterium]|nr:glycosyltransferase family 2 protein [Lachnospiraceae bacterium]